MHYGMEQGWGHSATLAITRDIAQSVFKTAGEPRPTRRAGPRLCQL